MRCRMLVVIRDHRGGVMIPVIFGIVIFSVAAGVIAQRINEVQKIKQRLSVSQGAERARSALVGLILDPRSWAETQNGNTAAFAGPVSSGSLATAPSLKIRDAVGATFYNSTLANTGFTPAGELCDHFTETGSDTCPFRYEVKLYTHEQINGSWVDTVALKLNYRPLHTNSSFNSAADRFTFMLRRNFGGSSAESACIATGGLYTGSTGSCSVQITQTVNCGSSFLSGPTIPGSPASCVVALRTPITCPPPQVVKKFNSTGDPVCGDPI